MSSLVYHGKSSSDAVITASIIGSSIHGLAIV